MKKPEYLYHASPNKNIDVFEPRAETVRDPNEGPVVFATTSEAKASKFLVPTNDNWSESGAFNQVNYIVISDEERFRNLDKGGSIYTIPSDTFYQDPKIRGGSSEWVSKEPVKPVAKEDFESGLDTMIEFGVQVYFVDKKTFEKIQNSEDHGYEILKKLDSENKKRNMNIINLWEKE